MSKTLTSLLLVSALFVTPAAANWFSDPVSNTHLNIGSAPNPKPEDLRRLYGGARFTQAPAPRSAMAARADEGFRAPAAYTPGPLSKLEGRVVYGSRGARLGYVLAVDERAGLAQLQTPSGIAVAVPAALLTVKGERITAPTMARADVMAMAKTQTGRMVAMNVDHKGRRGRA